LVGAAALLALVVALGAWASADRHTANAGGDPLAAVQALLDGANAAFPAGDGAPFANAFTEDGFFESIEDGSFGAVGRDALASIGSGDPDPDFHVTLVSSQVDGNTVTGVVNVTDRNSVAAEVDRYVQPFTAVVDGGLVSSLKVRLDTSDAQTATYLAYQQSQGGDDEGPPPDGTTIDMAGDQPGQAFIADADDGVAFIGVQIDPAAEGAIQPAHIHTGTCASPGPVVYPIASIVDGGSFTALSVSKADLLSNNYIVNVHLSADAMGTYVSCAVLEAPAPAPQPTTVLPKTGTGGPSGESPWLVIALMTAGAAMLAGLGAVRMARR
jgi:hypothetical protein